MNKNFFLFFSLFFFAHFYAMEKEATIEPLSPRLWIQSLQNFKGEDKEIERAKFLNEVIKLINKQSPCLQLELYTNMIEVAIETEGSSLITLLCSRFNEVFSKHFYGTADESKTYECVEKLKEKLKFKKPNHSALKLLHFSSTGALPPLKEDSSDTVLKRSVSSAEDINRLKGSGFSQKSDGNDLKNLGADCCVFKSKFTTLAHTLFENKLITALSDGSISVFDLREGRLVFASKNKAKDKKPLLICNKIVLTNNKDLLIRHLRSGHSVFYAVKKSMKVQCLVLSGQFIITGNSHGIISYENLEKKGITSYQGHETPITTLYALSKFNFLSTSRSGDLKIWNVKNKKLIKAMHENFLIRSFTVFDKDLLFLCGENQIKLLNVEKMRSKLLVKIEESVKALIGTRSLLIAGLKNGGLRLWHKDEGFGRTALLHLNGMTSLVRMAFYEDTLFCFYRDGKTIKFPYKFLEKSFDQALAHNFDSLNNEAPFIFLEEK